MNGHSRKAGLEVCNNLIKSIRCCCRRNISILIKIDEILHTLYRFCRSKIFEGTTLAINEGTPWLLTTLGSSHTEAIYIGLTIAIRIQCALLHILKELFISLRNVCNSGLLKNRWSIVNVPGCSMA